MKNHGYGVAQLPISKATFRNPILIGSFSILLQEVPYLLKEICQIGKSAKKRCIRILDHNWACKYPYKICTQAKTSNCLNQTGYRFRSITTLTTHLLDENSKPPLVFLSLHHIKRKFDQLLLQIPRAKISVFLLLPSSSFFPEPDPILHIAL